MRGSPPKETWYGGRKYRSRTEARWAVILDNAVGVEWTYEEEGFDVPGFWGYLPDFHITAPLELWLEVKGDDADLERGRMTAAGGILPGGLLIVGYPNEDVLDWAWLHLPSRRYVCLASSIRDGTLRYAAAPAAPAEWVKPVKSDLPAVPGFYRPGVSARFEWGETPAVPRVGPAVRRIGSPASSRSRPAAQMPATAARPRARKSAAGDYKPVALPSLAAGHVSGESGETRSTAEFCRQRSRCASGPASSTKGRVVRAVRECMS